MSRTWTIVGVGAFMLMLVGAGCSKDADTNADNTNGDSQTPSYVTTDVSNTTLGDVNTTTTASGDQTMQPAATDADLTLHAEALGGGSVKLTWDTSKKLTDANRFIIIRGPAENPAHTGHDYWIRQFYTVREAVWSKLPTGTMHFRLCLTENSQNDTCASYSNDVSVEVQ